MTLDDGTYIVGEDIAAGKYNIIAKDSVGALTIYDTNNRAYVNTMLSSNDLLSCATTFQHINLKTGMKVDLDGAAEFVPANMDSTSPQFEEITLTAGEYIVGTDIAAGTYHITAIDGNAMGIQNLVIHYEDGAKAAELDEGDMVKDVVLTDQIAIIVQGDLEVEFTPAQ